MSRTLRTTILSFLLLVCHAVVGQDRSASLLFEPFVNRVFIAEHGQFEAKLNHQGMPLDEPVLFGLENAEFNAYFTRSGIVMRFAEYVEIPEEEREENEHEPEEQTMEAIWHTMEVNWLDANPGVEVVSEKKVHEYYCYSGIDNAPNINQVPAFDQLVYRNIYDGVDMILELPEEGGIKYRFEVAPGHEVPEIRFEWIGADSLKLDEAGDLLINGATTLLKDRAPTAFTADSMTPISIQYELDGNVVSLEVEASSTENDEGIIIDPWITNTNYPDINRAVDIQEDAMGNVVVQGNHTNFQVQKFNSAGVLQWTYVTNSTFLGDIAVDNPGNVYIVGGYSAGKRQKLDPNGNQLWQFAGLVEEWRLAFNYSKTVLTVGGYFVNPGGNNLAKLDMATGAISNQIVYGLETRSIATDCNGDMYSLHVDFGSAGTNAGNVLRKTNANFTPSGVSQSGFLLSESEPTAGYVPNPSYHPYIYQGFNGLVVSGLYVYISDGATVRRVDKNSLAVINSNTVNGGAKLMNSGMAADECGNIYVGSQTGIVKFDSTLNYIETIATPGAVYDIIKGMNGELLACGQGFVGSFPVICNPPPAIIATANNACDGTGSITIDVAGGLAPYTYEWQPGGMTTNPITGLSAGIYEYTVNDAFCRTFVDSVEIYQNPTPAFAATGVNTSNTNPNSVCLGETMQFADNSVANAGNIVSWEWDFDDGNTSSAQSPTHTYTTAGTYNVKLVVTTSHGCVDSLETQVMVDPLPTVDFTFTDACFNDANTFTDASSITSGSVTGWGWVFGDGNVSTQQHPSHTYAAAGTYTVELTAVSANGCSASTQYDVEAYDLPVADFTFPSTCVNDPTDLIDNSTEGDGAINAWQWDVEGQTLNGASVQHVFSGEGNFPVQLTVTDQFGCVDSITQQVNISVRPDISISVTNDCAGIPIAFMNNSTIPSGSIDSAHWDMGDGNTYTSVSPAHAYTDAGNYTVQLYLESDLGCSADTAFPVEAYPNPVAMLQWSNECDGTPITFNETSVVSAPGQLLPSDWNMGDGTVLTDTTIGNYAYSGYGDYTVQLSVETQHGCTDSQNFTVSVHAVPNADFSFTNVCETDSALFTDQTNIAQGNVVDWQWSFGNGQNFNGAAPGYQVYPADGLYPVQLTVTSDSACTDVHNDTIEIYPTPIAAFTFDSVCYPLSVQFTDLSDPNGAYNINQWVWEFTDGQILNTQSPAVSFPQFGAYGATLTITNSAGCKDEIALGDALVHPVPVADYSGNLQHCFTDTFAFSDLSTLDVLSDDAIVSWSYDLGDGNTDSNPDGTHGYASAGFYDVQLTAVSNHGCEDDETKTIEVWPLPQVAFDAEPKEGCDPLYVQLTDQSSIPAPYSLSQWQWTVGDGSDDILDQNPNYTYDPSGLAPNDFATYDVRLIVTSGNGCKDSLSYNELITVHPVPEAMFSTDPEKLATIVNPLFQFTDLSTINVSSWEWSFGDGLGSTVQHPEYTYQDTGTYTITLAVATDFGCTDTVSYKVIVEPYFSFYIPSAFTPNNDGVNDAFFGAGEHLTDYNMQIFDRWGELLFESNEQEFKWDGTYKGAAVEAGLYVYQFNIIDWEGNDHQYRGGVQLLR